jgi:uracil-DNA glycosylase family 4
MLSELNKWSKKQGDENRQEILYELSDALLFLMNFANVRKITPDEILATLEKVQEINFLKLKAKQLAMLSDEMIRVPSKRVGLGGGNPMPSVIIIGQNPGQSLSDDQNCWDDPPSKSAVGYLKRALKFDPYYTQDDVYFTNIVKEVTKGNSVPTHTMVKFWQPFLERELAIVMKGATPKILAMGTEATRTLTQEEAAFKWHPIMHPSYYMRRGFSEKEYYDQVLKKVLTK